MSIVNVNKGLQFEYTFLLSKLKEIQNLVNFYANTHSINKRLIYFLYIICILDLIMFIVALYQVSVALNFLRFFFNNKIYPRQFSFLQYRQNSAYFLSRAGLRACHHLRNIISSSEVWQRTPTIFRRDIIPVHDSIFFLILRILYPY